MGMLDRVLGRIATVFYLAKLTGGDRTILSKEVLAKYMGAFAYPVGDSEASNAQILALMGSRVKTGVCDSWSIYEDQTEDLRVVGSVDIALNWGGAPAIAIRTLSVERIVFDQMNEARVAQQGEFRVLANWRLGYEAYLARTAGFCQTLN